MGGMFSERLEGLFDDKYCTDFVCCLGCWSLKKRRVAYGFQSSGAYVDLIVFGACDSAIVFQ